jgi:hypothetical protein
MDDKDEQDDSRNGSRSRTTLSSFSRQQHHHKKSTSATTATVVEMVWNQKSSGLIFILEIFKKDRTFLNQNMKTTRKSNNKFQYGTMRKKAGP